MAVASDVYQPIEPAYTTTARVLHWVTAVLVLAMIPIGIIMANEWGGEAQDFLYDLHRSTGMLLLVLVLIRLAYRLTHPPAPLPQDLPFIQRFGAEAVHWALYALLVLQPIIGWIATSAYRAPIRFFWLLEVPPIWREDRAFSDQMFALHRLMGYTIAALLCLHIGAALFHHFVRRDRVLMRMVTGG